MKQFLTGIHHSLSAASEGQFPVIYVESVYTVDKTLSSWGEVADYADKSNWGQKAYLVIMETVHLTINIFQRPEPEL